MHAVLTRQSAVQCHRGWLAISEHKLAMKQHMSSWCYATKKVAVVEQLALASWAARVSAAAPWNLHGLALSTTYHSRDQELPLSSSGHRQFKVLTGTCRIAFAAGEYCGRGHSPESSTNVEQLALSACDRTDDVLTCCCATAAGELPVPGCPGRRAVQPVPSDLPGEHGV